MTLLMMKVIVLIIKPKFICRLTGLFLSTSRYDAQRPAADAHLSGRITEQALERRRFGYRRIWPLPGRVD